MNKYKYQIPRRFCSLGTLALGAFLIYLASPAGWSGQAKRANDAGPQLSAVSRAKPSVGYYDKPIERIRVGERIAPVKNPDGSFDASLGREIDPPNWRKITLRARKSHGGSVYVEMLRPLWWIDEHRRKYDGDVYLVFDELDVDGRAKLLTVEPCPTIPAGTGPVVIGTVRHSSATVYHLHLEGLADPLGVTAGHPFWSETRNRFIATSDLSVGEQLRVQNGSCKVRRITRLSGARQVYNLEIFGEHVYRVASTGVLTHNNGECFPGSDGNALLGGGLNPHPDGSVRLLLCGPWLELLPGNRGGQTEDAEHGV